MNRIAVLLLINAQLFAAELIPSIITTRIPSVPVTQMENIGMASSSCIIKQSECVSYPAHAGSFNDTHEGSNLLSNRCLRRAFEYSLNCGNHKGTVTTATFKWADGKEMSASSIATGLTCTISQQECAVYPWLIGSFADGFEYENAQSEPVRCVQRARDYSIYCANPVGAVTTATLVEPNGNTTSQSYVSKGTSCRIFQSYCKSNPMVVGMFIDNFANVAENAPRCLARAKEYAEWCENKHGMQTKAVFTNANGTTVESTYFVP